MSALEFTIRDGSLPVAIARAPSFTSNCMVAARAPLSSSSTDPILHGRERAGCDDAVGAPLFAARAAASASRGIAKRSLSEDRPSWGNSRDSRGLVGSPAARGFSGRA